MGKEEKKGAQTNPEQTSTLSDLALKILADLEQRLAEFVAVVENADAVIEQANAVLREIADKRTGAPRAERGTGKTYKPIPKKKK